MKRFVSVFAAIALAFTATSAWAQQEQLLAPLPNDPAVKVGKLDNGLTYYIRHNELPAGRAEFYLATNVGAIQEEYPAQDGLAHFLEHMCFNGTAHFPDKAILDYLRSIGAEFGRNINASTGFEETQYMLNNIPVARESVVDSCLMILCDYAHFVNNDPSEVDKERGVIIEERRTRRNAGWRTMERSLPYYFPGTKMADCTLIGTQEHLETFDPQALVNFYRTWYHPDMQAVVVVGDIDVDRTEAKIKEIFSVIPACENPKPKEHLTVPENKEPIVGILTDPESTSVTIEMGWRSEAMPESYNAGLLGRIMSYTKSLISMVMSERFDDITAKPDAPFLGGGFYVSSLIYEDIDAAMGDVTLKEDNIIDGFKAFYTELLRMQRHGFSDAEVERAKTDLLSRLEDRKNKASTRRNAEFVRPILSNFFDNTPFMDPEMEYQIAQMLLGQLDAAYLSQTVGQLITPENLVILYSGPEKAGIATPTEAQILAAKAEVEASDIAALDGEELPSEFLNSAKLKGKKVKSTSTVIYGATQWILKNGLKVVVLPTDYTKDQILIDLYKDGGLSLIEDNEVFQMDDMFDIYLRNSGISKFSYTQVTKMLSGKSVNMNPYINNLEHGISGNSTVRDLETAFQLLYLYFTDPRFDADEFNTGLSQIRSYLPNLLNNPEYIFQEEYTKSLWKNNPRRQVISMSMLDKADLKVIEKNYRKLFKDVAGATLVIVGDVDLNTLQPLVEKYCGSLPKGRKATNWIDRNMEIAEGWRSNQFKADMQTPKSTVLEVYSAFVDFSYATRVNLDALKYILDMRYTQSLREEEGGTYGASVATSLNRQPKSQALLQVYFDCKPELTARLCELAEQGMKDMANDGPTEAEVSMAILNLKKNIPENRLNNSYWRGQIENWLEFGDDYDSVRESVIDGITPESIRAIAAQLLESRNYVEVIMTPGATAE
jgi:zinc protease